MTRQARLYLSSFLFLFCLLLPLVPARQAQRAYAAKPPAANQPRRDVCGACVRAHMEFLASDALRGRGSASHDELVAASYVGAALRAYGIEPGADAGYLEPFTIVRSKLTAPPQMKFMTAGDGSPAQAITWTHGKEILALELTQAAFSGPLQRIDLDRPAAKARPGSLVFVTAADRDKLREKIAAVAHGAAGVLVPASGNERKDWHELDKKLPPLPTHVPGQPPGFGEPFNLVLLSEQAESALNQLPDGTILRFEGNVAEEKATSWNAIGILRGQQKNAILLSAHLDHLGIGAPVNGDKIYNGADDDASGTAAVLELARALGAGPKPRRTVIFALFGSEEIGGLGSMYFREHPPVPMNDVVADLEFEMLGRPDPKLPADVLWLSGWERSNLGPELAAHGAKLVADPHPEENFFRRSDNYMLAKKGVVAQTVSTFGLHKDYHQPSDDLAHIDFQHMTMAIGSLLEPVEWLVNSEFVPQWNDAGRP